VIPFPRPYQVLEEDSVVMGEDMVRVDTAAVMEVAMQPPAAAMEMLEVAMAEEVMELEVDTAQGATEPVVMAAVAMVAVRWEWAGP
jgi:hypothetical protein